MKMEPDTHQGLEQQLKNLIYVQITTTLVMESVMILPIMKSVILMEMIVALTRLSIIFAQIVSVIPQF